MARLVCNGRDVASLVVADTVLARTRGLLGSAELQGAILLSPARSVHTLGMRFSIDVAHLDSEFRVLAVTTMSANRVGRWVRDARHVLEASAGAFAEWGVAAGGRLEIAQSAAA